MPTTNCGAEMVTKENTISPWSMGRLRLSAAMVPMVRPMTSSTTMAATMSRSVAGIRAAISSVTSVRCR